MPITMKDIAERAGVTRSAVSAVFNKSSTSRVSAKVRKRILDICTELNYKPNFVATALKKRRTGLIGFICGGLDVPFFSELTMSLTNEAEKRDCRIMLTASRWDRKIDIRTLNEMLNGMCDGIFVCRSLKNENQEIQERIRSSNVPVITLENIFEELSSVCFDIQTGMQRTFIELLNNGHSTIAFAGQKSDTAKLEAYQTCCREFEVKPAEYLCTWQRDFAEVVETGRKIARNRDKHSALISTDFVMSIMIQGMDAEGLSIPEDLSVIVFNNTMQSRFFRPPLTAISLDTEIMARRGVETMLELIEKRLDTDSNSGDENSTQTSRVIISPELVRRNSVRKLS